MDIQKRLQQVEAQFSEAEEQIKTLENLRHQLIGQATILREIINAEDAAKTEEKATEPNEA
jgi:hypothetical protein